MNQTSAYAFDSLFGPPSEPIVVADFIPRSLRSSINARREEHNELLSIEGECSMDDITGVLNETLSTPLTWVYAVKQAEDRIAALYEASTKQRKRKRAASETPTQQDPSSSERLSTLREGLERVQLKSWPYPPESCHFIRPPKLSDQNTFDYARQNDKALSIPTEPESNRQPEAILVVSVHTRASWGNHITRSSQHVLQGSQSLLDLYDIIPCVSKLIPEEKFDGERFIGYKDGGSPPSGGAVICIEGVAYGLEGEKDYAEMLLQHITSLPENKRPILKKGRMMHEQRLVDLSLRLHEPCWLVHQGDCEHFIVIDQIRLSHSSDPPTGYPLTTHKTPSVSHTCQACTRVPAMWAVSGDIRLPQSPCALCAPCWRNMGQPKEPEAKNVVAVPLLY